MISMKRKYNETCPVCNSQVEDYPVNFDCSIEICNNVKCTYPFNHFSAEDLIIETPNTINKWYSKSSVVSSSTVINSVALSTPVSDEVTIATPAKKARTGTYQPVSGSSKTKQTDQSHSKPMALDANSVSNKENLPSTESIFDDILNVPLTIETSSTPFMFDTSLFNDTQYQNHTTDSSTTSPICHTSPSNSSFSTGNSNDAFFSDISETYSPPSSTDLASSAQLYNKKNITQTPPKEKHVSLPGNLALPPPSAAKTVSNNNDSKYTMTDINNLLNDDDILPPTNSTSVTSWIDDFDYLFP